MLVAGVDIGIHGAIALVDAETLDLIEVHDMPTLSVNPPLLADLIYRSHIGHAFVEHVGARPGEGAVGAFAFGRSKGVVDGVLGAAGVPATQITPPVWKRAIGLPTGKDGAKDAARSEAIRRWPSKASLFARIKDDGRAEAALIAVAGLMRLDAAAR
jgi:hypothetical protein